MAAIGIRELKASASRIIRRVRERGEEIEVTYHGTVVARLVPASRAATRHHASASVWSNLDRVAKEIGAAWPKGRSATAAVREGRRDL